MRQGQDKNIQTTKDKVKVRPKELKLAVNEMIAAFLLLLIVTIVSNESFQILRSSELKRLAQSSSTRMKGWFNFQSKSNEKNSTKTVKITEECKKAFEVWKENNKSVKEDSPGYLSLERCAEKFAVLQVTIGNAEEALSIVTVDPSILSYGEKRVEESLKAWIEKIGNQKEALALIKRNPPILSIPPKFIKDANQGDIVQTYFWSYVAVLFRPLTNSLQKLIQR